MRIASRVRNAAAGIIKNIVEETAGGAFRSPLALAAEPLWHLVYRYWFWGWLFVDVNTGDLLRRAAAWRHNVAQRVHLPVYMRRWCACLLATFAIAAVIEACDARAAAAAFYVVAVLSAVVELTAGIAWVFLRQR